MKRWYVFIPGNIYAYGPIEAPNFAAAKQWVREWLKVIRLPRGVAIWEAGPIIWK